MGYPYYTEWRNDTLNARMETDKKYLILKMGSHLITTAGLGWYIIHTLNGIRFAVDNGYIPVVDWRNCKIPNYDVNKIGLENIWEYFFEQPCHVDLFVAYSSNDFFIVDDIRTFPFSHYIEVEDMVDFLNTDFAEWREYFQKYIRLKKEVVEYFNRLLKRQMGANKMLIGVLMRGTDYRDLKPVGHFCPITIEECFCHIQEWEGRLAHDKIFIATEDQCILNAFEKKYPDNICSVNAKRYDALGHETINLISQGEDGYERDLKYLYSLYTISRSPVAIYAACGGGALAALMRKNIGLHYQFLCHGKNRAKAIIVGSSIERKMENIVFLGNKPIMFYPLNTLKLLNVDEVDIIVTETIKTAYEEKIGTGEEFGIKIKYTVSQSYDVMEYMIHNPGFMTSSRLILLYADHFVHGKDVIAELSRSADTFDGAYVWGVKNIYADSTDRIEIDREHRMPKKAFSSSYIGNYIQAGRYVFDYDLPEVIKVVCQENGDATLSDVLNEYIRKKKLFFFEYPRGVVYSKMTDIESLKKTSELISLLECIQRQTIGDFESFRV